MTLSCNYITMLVRSLLRLCILELITECNEESADGYLRYVPVTFCNLFNLSRF